MIAPLAPRTSSDTPASEPVTLAALVARVVATQGTLAAVGRALEVSRQRLYSATHGGPALRADRLVRLALIANVEPTTALRVGGQVTLADLLDQAYGPRIAETTIQQRTLWADFVRLSERTQQLVRQLIAGLIEADAAARPLGGACAVEGLR